MTERFISQATRSPNQLASTSGAAVNMIAPAASVISQTIHRAGGQIEGGEGVSDASLAAAHWLRGVDEQKRAKRRGQSEKKKQAGRRGFSIRSSGRGQERSRIEQRRPAKWRSLNALSRLRRTSRIARF